jgi:pimeloyl-ACP methyl ester carboxylesterase
MLASLPECANRFAVRHVDVTRYLTTDAVADLDDVRRALGYAALNLWGGSYGTRVALEYIREYPQHVRSAVLDGVAPSSLILPVDLSTDSDAALTATISSCAADAACSKAYPNLKAQVDQMFAQLGHGNLTARLADPVTGTVASVPLTADTFAAWVRTPLYNPLTESLVPEAIASAATGDFDTLAALNLSVSGDIFDQLSLGMHLSVVCSEDMAHVHREALASLSTARFKDTFYRLYQSMCERWKTRPVKDDFFSPLHSDRPILMLDGGRDPATPPRHAQALLSTLSNARLVVAKNLGHGLSSVGCAPDLIDQFIRTADPRALDTGCLENIPATPFFLPLKARSST